MKLKRVIQLPEKNETLTIELEADPDNFLYSVDLIEKRARDVYDFFEGKVKVPKSPPKPEKKEKPTSSKSEEEGTFFDGIALDTTDFNLFGVKITRIGEIQTGTGANTGNTWTMQSITVRDVKNKSRDLIAWGDQIDLFYDLEVDNMIDIELISKIKEYKGKHQYTLGSKTEIRGAE